MPLLPSSVYAKKPTESIRWICFPYVSLQNYSGFGSVFYKHNFPPQTLLQGQYSRTAKQRDMEQVFRQHLSMKMKGDECLHVAQLWCCIFGRCEMTPAPPTCDHN